MLPLRVPPALRELSQWVVWRVENREGKATKVPYQPNPARLVRASTGNPSTWGSLENALQALQGHKLEGLGFVFAPGGGVVGVDLDWKGYEGQGVPLEAQTIADRLNSYTEWSPSRKGCHILLRGSLPQGTPHRKQLAPGVELEVYDRGRYFTVTGRHWAGYPDDLQERQAELEALLAELFPPAPMPGPQPVAGLELSDSEALETLFRLVPRARPLWEGNTSEHGGDHSRADMALASFLMWITGNDEARADRLFRQSRLYRPKWDERHAGDGRTYGQMTLQKARALEPYTPRAAGRLSTGTTGATEGQPSACPLDGLSGGGFVLTGYPRYRVRAGAIEAGKLEREQVVYYRLANLAAVITREVARTDGVHSEILFELEGYAGPRPLPLARVRASEFAGMGWVVREWGAGAVVTPG
ncbi:hypothetical protein, partial [Calidithermus terrae]|uniref:phage NrS-1 polymerase family protein n=1 Tax=Calidithermus terrae TaxID=1408545 RepID=UPI000E64AAAC